MKPPIAWPSSGLTGGLAVLLAAVAGLLIFILAPNAGMAVGGAWTAFLALLVGGVAILLRASKRLVGEADALRPGYRNVALSAAVLIALAISPVAGQEIAATASRTADAAFRLTPELIDGKPATGPTATGTVSGRNAMISSLYDCVMHARCGDQSSAPTAAGNRAVGLLIFAAAFLSVLLVARAISEARAVFNYRMLEENADVAAVPAPPTDRTPPQGRRASDNRWLRFDIMPYPTWVAFLIYVLILAPATYLAVGALLHLRTEPAAANSAELALALDREGETAVQAMPGVRDFDAVTLGNAPQVWAGLLEPIEVAYAGPRAVGAVATWPNVVRQLAERGRQLNEQIVVGRAAYEADAIHSMGELHRRAEAADVADFRALISSHYAFAIQRARANRRPCLESLRLLQQSLPARIPAVTPAEQEVLVGGIAVRIRDAEERCGEEIASFPTAIDARVVTTGLDTTDGASSCRGAACDTTLSPSLARASYAWLLDSPQSTVLIAGLVGFGLFGSAIRMMGRVDRTTVTPEELAAARMRAAAEIAKVTPLRRDADVVRREAVAAQERCTTLQRVADSAAERLAKAEEASVDAAEGSAMQRAVTEARAEFDEASRDALSPTQAAAAAEQAAVAAAALLQAAEDAAQAQNEHYQQLKRRQLNDRSNIVVKRLSRGREEFVVSGAAAKVFVQGLGAAFTVFLAGQAMGRLLSEGGRVSVYSLLLSCFVGAVFAEEIWRWAKRFLPADDAPSDPGSARATTTAATTV